MKSARASRYPRTSAARAPKSLDERRGHRETEQREPREARKHEDGDEHGEGQEHEDADRVGRTCGPRAKRRARDQGDGSHVAQRDQQRGGQHEPESPGARRVAPGESVDDDHGHSERERLPEAARRRDESPRRRADRPSAPPAAAAAAEDAPPASAAAPWPERLLSGRCEHREGARRRAPRAHARSASATGRPRRSRSRSRGPRSRARPRARTREGRRSPPSPRPARRSRRPRPRWCRSAARALRESRTKRFQEPSIRLEPIDHRNLRRDVAVDGLAADDDARRA